MYTKTDRMGTYCLVDMEIFLDNLDKQLNDNENEAKIEVQSEVSEAMPENTVDNNTVLSYNVNKKDLQSSKSGNPDDFDVVFLIDCRSVSKDEEYALIIRNVIETADTVFVKSPKSRVRIIAMKSTAENPRYKEVVRGDIMQYSGTEAGSGYLYNIDEVYEALKFIKEHQKDVKGDCDVSSSIGHLYEMNKYNSKQVYAFCIVQPEGSLQNVNDSNDVLKDIKEKGTIQINTVFLMEAKNENEFSYANRMINYTGGKAHFKYDDSSEFMLGQIYNNPEVENGYKAIIGMGYRTVVFNSSLEQNYKWSNGKEKDKITEDDDLDNDGLYDYQEIMFKDSNENLLIKEKIDGSIQLLTYDEIIGKVGEELFYVKNGLERYCSATGENADKPSEIESFFGCHILPVKSDPTSVDSDEDGLCDLYDRHPTEGLNNDFFYVTKNYEPQLNFVNMHYIVSNSCYNTKPIYQGITAITWPLVGTLSIVAETTDLGTVMLSLMNNGANEIFSGTMPYAAYAIRHYLGNSGDTWILSRKDMVSLIGSQISNREHFVYNIQKMMEYAEENLEKNKIFYISTTDNAQFRGTCYYKKSDIDTQPCTMSHGNSKPYETSVALDWGHAIGESFAAMYCEFSYSGISYTMKYRYYIKDIYEWAAHYDQTTLSKIMHSYHESGVAKEYLINGYIDGEVTWLEGEDINSENILRQILATLI